MYTYTYVYKSDCIYNREGVSHTRHIIPRVERKLVCLYAAVCQCK